MGRDSPAEDEDELICVRTRGTSSSSELQTRKATVYFLADLLPGVGDSALLLTTEGVRTSFLPSVRGHGHGTTGTGLTQGAMSSASNEPSTNPLVAGATVKDTSGHESFVAVEPEHVTRPGKVPFEKGYSQMDWMFLCRKTKQKRPLRDVTMDEVMEHDSESDGWTVIDGKVYEISPYLKYHPGGAKILRVGLGKDCTALFRKYHAWVNYEMLLEKFLIGRVVK
jgi:hypothetical protein